MFIAAPLVELLGWDGLDSRCGLYERLAVAGEGRLDDPCGELPVADDDANPVAGNNACWEPRERDRLVERRAERPARDLAIAAIGAHHLVRAQHPALVNEHEAGELSRRSLRGECRLADEVARTRQIDGP